MFSFYGIIHFFEQQHKNMCFWHKNQAFHETGRHGLQNQHSPVHGNLFSEIKLVAWHEAQNARAP